MSHGLSVHEELCAFVFADSFRENYPYAVQDKIQPIMILKPSLQRLIFSLTSDWKFS